VDLHILVTSADIVDHPLTEMRKREYLKTIDWLKINAQKYKVSWLECLLPKDSFLETHIPVYYSQIHNPNYRNKGSNWGQAVEKFLKKCEYQSEYTMHLTGRYHFNDTYFFETIEKNPGFDLYVKKTSDSQYMTGCFCMRTENFCNWISNTDWDMLNYKMINVEKYIWDYTKENNLKVYEIDSLNMEWNVFGQGVPQMLLV